MNESTNEKPLIIFYCMIALAIVAFLNIFISQLPMKTAVTRVEYGVFLQAVENGSIKTAEIEQNQIGFIIPNEDGTESAYVTGRIDDPELEARLKAAQVEVFKEVIPHDNPRLVNIIVLWVLPLLVSWWLIVTKMSGKLQPQTGGIGRTMPVGRSNAKVYAETQSSKSFTEVAGQDEAKEALQEIVDFLHNPQKYKEVGARIPKGALLVGPPGTGKTLLAQTVAGETKVPFFIISGSEFVEMYVGLGAARVRDLFKQAQEKAPCIIFIDELDAIGKKRNSSGINGGNEEREQTLNQLLVEMDGFDAENGVVILAATNRPETLDKALLRPGRFDRRIPVELPDLAGREAILQVHAQKVKLADDIDLKAIARATPGASGADLANIINEGALRAVKLGRKQVIQSDLEESIEVVIAGYKRKNMVLSEKEKLTIAYHEVGHAIITARQNHALVHKITIGPRTSGALGYTMQVDENEQVLLSREQAMGKIATLMGGRSAEEIVFNTVTSGAANDIEQATKIARAMVTRFGMSEKFDMMALETVNNPYLGGDTTLLVSAETASKIDTEVFKIIKSCHDQASEILRQHIDKMHELAKYLAEKETLSGPEFMEMLLN
jgi:ATP-dependent metalloprotease FtsH